MNMIPDGIAFAVVCRATFSRRERSPAAEGGGAGSVQFFQSTALSSRGASGVQVSSTRKALTVSAPSGTSYSG